MEYVKDSWVRDCTFDHWNEGVFLRAGYRVTLEGNTFGGKGGHSTIHARSGYGVLIRTATSCLAIMAPEQDIPV